MQNASNPESNLEARQIPSKPLARPPRRLSWLLYRIVRKVWDPIRKYHIRMEAEATIRALGSVGSRPTINGKITIHFPHQMSLGVDVHINPGFYAACGGGLTIGSHVHFGQNTRILTQNHNYDNNPQCLPYDKVYVDKPVVIGDCVWVGDNVIIVPGVSIGEGAIIALGSVVVKDVPPLAIVGGAPARILKMRDKDTYCRLKSEGKFLNWASTYPAFLSIRR